MGDEKERPPDVIKTEAREDAEVTALDERPPDVIRTEQRPMGEPDEAPQ